MSIILGEQENQDFGNNDFHEHTCFDMIKQGNINSFFTLMNTKQDLLLGNAYLDQQIEKTDFLFSNTVKAMPILPGNFEKENLLPLVSKLYLEADQTHRPPVLSGIIEEESMISGETNSLGSRPSKTSNNITKTLENNLCKCYDIFINC